MDNTIRNIDRAMARLWQQCRMNEKKNEVAAKTPSLAHSTITLFIDISEART